MVERSAARVAGIGGFLDLLRVVVRVPLDRLVRA
jgi:hypothetical protein